MTHLYLTFCIGWFMAFLYGIWKEKKQQNGHMPETVIASLIIFMVMTPIILSIT